MLGSRKKDHIPTRPSDEVHYQRGPELAFAASTIAAFSGWAALKNSVPAELVLPAVATMLFGFAAVASLLAWRQRHTDHEAVTYWDVAGALVLCGLVLATTIDPQRLALFLQHDSAF